MEFACLQPQINKEFILSKVNQESIMQHYSRLDVGSKKLQLSPIRGDHKVTVSFYKSKSGILYMHDFATGEHINCFELVKRLYNCNYYQALKIIAQDFNLVEGNSNHKQIEIVEDIKETESSIIQCQIKNFSQEELEWWNSFGINEKILKKYHIYSIQHIFLNGVLKFSSTSKNPIYGYYFGKDKNGKEKWKCYMPARTSYRFLGNLPKKVLQGYKQLPKTGKLLVINKSMKDTAALSRFNIPSVSPNSETIMISEKQIEELKTRFKYILVIFDNDRAGLKGLYNMRKLYPDLNYFYIPKNLGAKDFTDLIKLKGIEFVKSKVIEFLLTYNFK